MCSFIVVWCLYCSGSARYVEGTVYINSETRAARYAPNVMDRKYGTAYGYYDNSLNETGFSVLEIKTRMGVLTDNKQLMYAAGYLEGVLTAK